MNNNQDQSSNNNSNNANTNHASDKPTVMEPRYSNWKKFGFFASGAATGAAVAVAVVQFMKAAVE